VSANLSLDNDGVRTLNAGSLKYLSWKFDARLYKQTAVKSKMRPMNSRARESVENVDQNQRRWKIRAQIEQPLHIRE